MNALKHLFLFSFLILFFAHCAGPENPEFLSMQNIKFNAVQVDNGLGVTLKGDALLNNPNSVGVKINSMDFDVFADGRKVTKVRQELSASMKANSDFSLPLEFDIPLKEVIDQIKKPANLLDMAKKMEIPIKVEGHLKVAVAGTSLRIPVNYEEPYPISLKTLLGK